MLDVRATNYITPLAEVPFTDVPLSVRLVNAGDEPAYITGLFRVYNDTTTELIFSSEIAPLLLTSGQSSSAPALTDFSPPAPADDTYFVKFDGFADNPIVPNRITLTLGAFHFDVKPGPLGDPPAAHAPTHEQAGADPIETSDLGTSEVDTALRLAPDGAGGVAWNPNVPALVRAVGTASSATPTPNADTTDLYFLSALAEGATFGAPTGSPVDGQKLVIRILDNGTARALAWNAGAGGYIARGVALPVTTVLSKYLFVGLIYNAIADKWDCVASSQEA